MFVAVESEGAGRNSLYLRVSADPLEVVAISIEFAKSASISFH